MLLSLPVHMARYACGVFIRTIRARSPMPLRCRERASAVRTPVPVRCRAAALGRAENRSRATSPAGTPLRSRERAAGPTRKHACEPGAGALDGPIPLRGRRTRTPGRAGGPALLFGGAAPGYRLISLAPTTRRHGRGGHPVLGPAGSCDRRADAHPAPDLYAGTPSRRSAAQLSWTPRARRPTTAAHARAGANRSGRS